MIFQNRIEAGEKLAAQVVKAVQIKKGLVLGIPRGGVVVAKKVAEKLNWPFEVMVTKKIGFPANEELAIGAVCETGEPVWDEEIIERYGISKETLQNQVQSSKFKVKSYIKQFRRGKPLEIKAKTVILVDDGIATGRTMEAGIQWLRVQSQELRLIVAVPVCAKDTADRLRSLVDGFICLYEPHNLMAVGQFYRDFPQVSDAEVIELLQ